MALVPLEEPKQLYEITGIICSKDWTKGQPTIFSIQSATTGKKWLVICAFFAPARVGDSISGFCSTLPDGRMCFLKEPLLMPSCSKDNIITTFIILLRRVKTNFGKYQAERLYDFFETECRKRIALLSENITTDGLQDSVFRNRDLLPAACAEMITLYANRFITNESTILPLTHAGLTEEQARVLLTEWYTNWSLRRLYMLGLTWTEVNNSILRGRDISGLYYQLLENPYIVETISMEKAESICFKYGLVFDNQMKAAGELVRFIDKETEAKGFSCYPLSALEVKFMNVSQLLPICKKDYGCIVMFNSIYLGYQYETETTLMKTLVPRPTVETFCSGPTKAAIGNCEEQIKAIELALNNNQCLIVGGAGTGKSTVIRNLCRELDLRGLRYIICSYTGKSISRIKQIFGGAKVNAMTLHMLLARGPKMIGRVDYLIIDEISMVPNALLAQVLIKLLDYNTDENWATKKNERKTHLSLVMVGDASQIPPIDPGNLANELLKSNIPKIRLFIDHRVKNETGVLKSNTVQFARYTYDELEGRVPKNIQFEYGADCNFIEGEISEIESLFRNYNSANNNQKDAVVICPYNAPLDELNERLCNIFLPNAASCKDCRGRVWRTGGKVMALRNFYDLDIMNGEEGIIRRFESDKLIVSFEGRTDVAILLATESLTEEGEIVEESENYRFDAPMSTRFLAYSYAITIHKSQGSEWKTVVVFLPSKFKSGFVTRNLFYTAISRAKENLYIVGYSPSSVDLIVSSKPVERFDNLAKRLNLPTLPLLTN
ncbi:MAG: hypothetical protein Solivirus3_18 [Solivirus sp.]|uniref:AAA+ ATPase domain-containing protein n=1 Tax=Solivirus sp. TaxID=2487772 RepID=A0A3G5AFW3_9VIRU|nr:MAG: hypothetical protein Solivirus3_18 [Solivirus sp.]